MSDQFFVVVVFFLNKSSTQTFNFQRKQFTHQELIFGVKGDTEDGSFVASECFLLAAVWHLHHLDHEVAEENRETENKYVQTGMCSVFTCDWAAGSDRIDGKG